jgi:hypothetical protein
MGEELWDTEQLDFVCYEGDYLAHVFFPQVTQMNSHLIILADFNLFYNNIAYG